MLFTAKMKRVRGEERKGGGPWWVWRKLGEAG